MSRPSHRPTGELALIEQIRSTFASTHARRNSLALGIGDDCAILRPPKGHEILVTTDFSLENRHFRRDLHPAASVGHRCLARGLSDLAAMGAQPLAAFLSLALPAAFLRKPMGQRWIKGFFEGLRSLARQHDTPLAGGDTSESPADLILADIMLVGSAPKGRALRRSEAHPGDLLYVTGALGGAHAELSSLLQANRPSRATVSRQHPHLFPQPRLAIGSALLRRRLATAAIDLSDGLSTDLTHLCESSEVCAEIESRSLPLHPLAQKLTAKDALHAALTRENAFHAAPAREEALHAALNGGEDYELLFAASAHIRIPSRIAGIPITRIGTLLPCRSKRPRILLQTPEGASELKPSGWEHFSS